MTVLILIFDIEIALIFPFIVYFNLVNIISLTKISFFLNYIIMWVMSWMKSKYT